MKDAQTHELLLSRRSRGESVRSIARSLGVNHGLVSAAINHKTYSPTLREALGLGPLVRKENRTRVIPHNLGRRRYDWLTENGGAARATQILKDEIDKLMKQG